MPQVRLSPPHSPPLPHPQPRPHRLKLRCDRAIPCGSCVKRGCAAICPDGRFRPLFPLLPFLIGAPHTGSLTTGKGNRYVSTPPPAPPLTSFSLSAPRFVLASTQDLHEKINQLSTRVRELEDALRASHSQQSLDPHPLLSDDLLRIKAPIQRENLINTGSPNGSNDEPGADVVDSFGSLAISDTGRTNYFGQATSSWARPLFSFISLQPSHSLSVYLVFFDGA